MTASAPSRPSRPSRRVSLVLAIVAFAASASLTHAQEAEDDSGLRNNCVGDYFRFCAAYTPGSLAIKQCFGRNFRQLTPACQNAITVFDRRNGIRR